ncbi:hypothetical protein, partial [Hydrotalea sp.]|uniref:hypothetical protein n=1 Tax=Hydrotalea sp. TaxID=2881279 RepID=UPI00261D8988
MLLIADKEKALAVAGVMTACNNAKSDEAKTDSTTAAKVDTAAAKVDTAAVKVDTAAAKVDTAAKK